MIFNAKKIVGRIFKKIWGGPKKVSSKSEEKLHTKMKMTSQRAEDLVHVQLHRGKYFYKKNIFLILLFIADMTI